MPFAKGHTLSRDRWAAQRQTDEAPPEETSSIVHIPIVISRFRLADLDQWGEGLLERLVQRWPHISRPTFAGRIRQWMESNDFLFVKTDAAIALATRTYEGLDPRPIVYGIFIWPVVPDRERAEPHIMALVRDIERWGRTMGAREARPGDDATMSPGRIKGKMTGIEERPQLFRKLL